MVVRTAMTRSKQYEMKIPALQWCQIENQQSPIYVVNSHFSRHPDDVESTAMYNPVVKGAQKTGQN